MAFKIRLHSKKEAAPLAVVQQAKGWVDHFEARRKGFVVGVGLVIILMIAAAVGQFLKYRAGQSASVLEAEASRLFHEPPPLPQPKEEGKPETPPEEMDKTARLKKAARLYDEILEKYPRSASAAVARYAVGHVYFELKDYDMAEKKYRAFVEKYPVEKYPHETEWVALVRLKLGVLFQIKGNETAALEQLRAVYALEGIRIRDQAGFELGHFLENASKKDEAIQIYQKVSKEFEKSLWGMEAQARLNILSPPTAAAAPSGTPAAPTNGVASPTTSSVSAPPLLKVTPSTEHKPAPPSGR